MSDEHTKPDTTPARKQSPAQGMRAVDPDVFGPVPDDDLTYGGQHPPSLMADLLQPPDLGLRPAAEQAQWRVLKAIEGHSRSAHERSRKLETDLREHRLSFAEHCADGARERLDVQTKLAGVETKIDETSKKVALSGVWSKVFTGVAATATLIGAIAGVLAAANEVVKSCEHRGTVHPALAVSAKK